MQDTKDTALPGIKDTALPGLADLSPARLCAITGAEAVDLLRLRYRPGKRAILHIAARHGAHRTEGTLWFFKGDKGKRLARRSKGTARFDPDAAALVQSFPHDHRMPQISAFLAQYRTALPGLTGAEAAAPPVLLRYRPGLSCTFRCALAGRAPAYVKLINDDDPARLRAANRAMRQALAQGALSVAPALGTDPAYGAIAYDSAPGRPLDMVLSEAGAKGEAALAQALDGLRQFRAIPLVPQRVMDAGMLLARARESLAFVAVTAPSCHAAGARVLDRLEGARPSGSPSGPPSGPLCPIHGDMKLEHLFLDPSGVTLIDTESVSLGLADYDLAQLYGRLWQAVLDGALPEAIARPAADKVRAEAGPAFDWCLGIVALRLAKFHAQRPSPDSARSIAAILDRLA